MPLADDVRASCAAIAADARHVTIDLDRIGDVEPGPEPALDPLNHWLDGSAEEVALFTLELDVINFGSGWFPTIRKRDGLSGSISIARALTEHGPWAIDALAGLDTTAVARVLGQDPAHELMALYAQALRELGAFLDGRTALAAVDAACGSAQTLAAQLADGMPLFDDPGFFKRAQITPADLALAGVAHFHDLDHLTIFADNLVPHVLRVDGVLRYDDALAAHIDSGEPLESGEREEEIRACAVHACAHIARQLGVPERTLDNWLWNRGQLPRYKAVPRHRTRSTAY